MIEVTPHQEGSLLPVRAKPGSRRNELIEERAGALLVGVTAAPEQGKANEAIITLLAEALNLKRSQIELVSGQTSRIKKFLVREVLPDDLMTRIHSALDPASARSTRSVPGRT